MQKRGWTELKQYEVAKRCEPISRSVETPVWVDVQSLHPLASNEFTNYINRTASGPNPAETEESDLSWDEAGVLKCWIVPLKLYAA